MRDPGDIAVEALSVVCDIYFDNLAKLSDLRDELPQPNAVRTLLNIYIKDVHDAHNKFVETLQENDK